ncbi:MAG: DUF4263 domain-containing protein [Nitrospinae bacterium]|nr:DUF4263 domain-containing protein [Nitrospinota bacterium]
MFLEFPDKLVWSKYAEQIEQLIQDSEGEIKLRKYFTENPWILSHCFCRNEGVVFSEYRVTKEEQADFLLVHGRSMNIDIIVIELKHPKAKILNKNGSMSEYLNMAFTKSLNKTIDLHYQHERHRGDITRYIKQLLSQEKRPYQGTIDKDFRNKARLPIEKYTLQTVIVIGNRNNETEDEKMFRQNFQLYDPRYEIIPYQRIIDMIRNH